MALWITAFTTALTGLVTLIPNAIVDAFDALFKNGAALTTFAEIGVMFIALSVIFWVLNKVFRLVRG